jgi:hypothetical protein
MGRGWKFPPQLGHVCFSGPSTQSLQNVHSKVQIMALRASAGNEQLQRSQLGFSFNMN